MAASERGGHLRDHDDVLVLKASTGLGLGIVAGGHLRPRSPRRRRRAGPRQGPGRRRPAAAAAATPAASRRSPGAGRWSSGCASRGQEVHHVRDLVAQAVHGRRRGPRHRARVRAPGGRGAGRHRHRAQPPRRGRRRRHGRRLRHLRGRPARHPLPRPPRRWPAATSSCSPRRTASAPASSAASGWPSTRCSPRAPWTPCWPAGADRRGPVGRAWAEAIPRIPGAVCILFRCCPFSSVGRASPW